jgi:hypothetical protein
VGGPAVICIDHVTKNSGPHGRGRFAIGGQHKLAGVTGAAYLFEPMAPLSRAITEAVNGVVAVTITKDRPGHVRGHAPGGYVGTMFITAWPDGHVDTDLVPLTEKPAENEPSNNLLVVAAAAVRAVKALNEEGPNKPPSLRLVIENMAVKAGRPAKIAAIEQAARLGAIHETPGPKGARLFTYLHDLDLEAI